MFDCSWNWGAIGSIAGAGATLIATIVAICIFKQWRNQKGSEVIANEANEIVKNLSVLHENIKYITTHSINKNYALSMFKDIEDLSNKNKRELLFLKASIVNENLEKLLDNFLKHERGLLITIEYSLKIHSNINDFLNEMMENKRIGELKLYTVYLDDLITIIRPYSLYKERVFFKDHKPKSI